MGKPTPPLLCTPENCGENYPRCAKASTYKKRHCRCDACKEAQSAYSRKQRARLRHSDEPFKHGTRYGYNIRGCRCRLCLDSAVAANRLYAERHPEKVHQAHRRYYEANRDACIRRARDHALSLPLSVRREMFNEYARLRRARVKAATIVPFTLEQLANRLSMFSGCYLGLPGCTGGFDHVDHVKPIKKGGAHMLANFRPACKSCNTRKRDVWPLSQVFAIA